MSINWMAVVSRARGEIFIMQKMTPVAVFENDLGRQKNRALTTDKPGVGRRRAAGRASTHRLDGEKDPHTDAAKVFARQMAKYLVAQWKAGRFEALVIAAEPRMAGWLRQHLPEKFADHVTWVKKDLGKLTRSQLKQWIGEKGQDWVSPFSS